EQLGEVGAAIAASLDRNTVMQRVIDLAKSLTGAEIGAFHCDIDDPESGETETLSTYSGAAHPATRPVFRATSPWDHAVMRVDDVTARRTRTAAAVCLPPGTAVKSYLAIPFRATSGKVLGQLCF